MRWKPVVVQSERSDGSLVVAVGHPFVATSLLKNLSGLGEAEHDPGGGVRLKVSFSFIDKTPVRVTSADVMAFITAQRSGDRGSKVVPIDE